MQNLLLRSIRCLKSTIDGVIDFSDNTLLGAASYDIEPTSYTDYHHVIFDREIFNQDIFITMDEVRSSAGVINYYMELEVKQLDLSESTVATLKDIRNETSQV